MDKQFAQSQLVKMRGNISKSHHLHSRMESETQSVSYPKAISEDQEYTSSNSILLSALHQGPSVQQLPMPSIGHRTPGATHLTSVSIGYQQNPHVPILQGHGLVNILPPGQGVTPSMKSELTGSSVPPLSLLRPAHPDFSMFNTVHLTKRDSTGLSHRINPQLSTAVETDFVKTCAIDDKLGRMKPKQVVASEHVARRNLSKDVVWNSNMDGRFDKNPAFSGNPTLDKVSVMHDSSGHVEIKQSECGAARPVPLSVYSEHTDMLRTSSASTNPTHSLFYRPAAPAVKTCNPLANMHSSLSGGTQLADMKTWEGSRKRDTVSSNRLNLSENNDNNGVLSHFEDFYDFRKGEKSFSLSELNKNNVTGDMQSEQSSRIYPTFERTPHKPLVKLDSIIHDCDRIPTTNVQDVAKFPCISNSSKENLQTITCNKDTNPSKSITSAWQQNSCETDIFPRGEEQATKVTVCLPYVETSTTSVHVAPIQSVPNVRNKFPRHDLVTDSQNVPKMQTNAELKDQELVSKSQKLHKLLKEMPISSSIKAEPTAHDLLHVAKKARDSQKAHLDAIKKTLEQSDLGLIPGRQVLPKEEEASAKQENGESSHTVWKAKIESVQEVPTCENETSIGPADFDAEQKLLERHDSTFNRRPCTLSNFPFSQSSFRTSYRSQAMAVHRAKVGSISTPVRSLDLLRQNLQKFINSELDSVIQKYMDMFFKPAMHNIRENSGVDAVSDNTFIMLCAQILEEAKKLYTVDKSSSVPEETGFDPGNKTALKENKEVRASKHSLFHIKRRGSSDSDRSVSRKRVKKSKMWTGISGRSTPSKKSSVEHVKKEGPKWDADRLTEETEFVMGARANKALGLGNMRGRLYVKHPDLFKYWKGDIDFYHYVAARRFQGDMYSEDVQASHQRHLYIGDQDDKQWLNENRHMPSTGGKAYLLVVQDILDIAETEEYKNSNSLQMDEIVSFTVPEWMIEKMKQQMKSQGTARGPKVKIKQAIDQDPEKLPFSSMYSSDELLLDSKSDFQGSPATTDQMDLLSVDQEELDTPAVSPFNMNTGFTESSALTSDLAKMDDEESLMASFQFQ